MRINLALQGGGALGAITWGVLDRLLEEPDLDFEGISGASAGAMNAVALAHGWLAGGREGARRSLAAFWDAIGSIATPVQLPLADEFGSAALRLAPTQLMLGITRFFSPYQINPLDINPLRSVVERQFDFERLRRDTTLKLFVGATHVRSGALRVFKNAELTPDHLLASACLPTVHHAVQIDGEPYWDGAYAGNPPLYPLLYDCKSADVLVVMLQPLHREGTPRTVDGIRARASEIQFSATFLREMRSLALAQASVQRSAFAFGWLERRLRALRFHLIEADEFVRGLDPGKALTTNGSFLKQLMNLGRERAQQWLARHRGDLGKRATLNAVGLFG
jgi:NTE family protein